MHALSNKLNPNVVKTALDKVFFQTFNGTKVPGYIDAMDTVVFRQEKMDLAGTTQEIFKGTGLWETKAEEQDVASDVPRVGNSITFNAVEYAKSVDITKNFFDDHKFDVVTRMMKDMGTTARVTMNSNAFGVFNRAFTTSLTADGAALISASHTTMAGTTITNVITGALSEITLNTAIIALSQQVNQAGLIMGNVPTTLVVPINLFKLACEIVDSELRSATPNNDINVYSSRYGITVKTSPFLTSPTAWFLLSENHSVTRWVRQGIETALVDWRYSRNNNYVYKGSFREVVGAIDYSGIVGSTG